MTTFTETLDLIQKEKQTLLCVGLDSDVEKLPKAYRKREDGQFDFNKLVIEATHSYVCAYKPNIAFYESEGPYGLWQLKQTIDYIHEKYPEIPVIVDAKRGDIGSSNVGYERLFFDYLGADAITVSPYLGREALEPLLAHDERGIIVLCKTSNPGAGELQDLEVLANNQLSSTNDQTNSNDQLSKSQTLWEYVARQVANRWNERGNVMLVVGATYPEELKRVRDIAGEMTILVPGVGAQGGDLAAVLQAGLNSENKRGLVINASRSIIFADDPGLEARNLVEEMREIQTT
jgi:orotidine-5'-phosphate decarboxylase